MDIKQITRHYTTETVQLAEKDYPEAMSRGSIREIEKALRDTVKKQILDTFDYWKEEYLDEGFDEPIDEWLSELDTDFIPDGGFLRDLDFFLCELYDVSLNSMCIWIDGENHELQVKQYILQEDRDTKILHYQDNVCFKDLDGLVDFIITTNKLRSFIDVKLYPLLNF